VVNGNLAYIDQPLFIGHYSSMALSGAEAVVDAQIGGTMSKALAMQAGHYPDALGTHLAFDNLKRDPDRPEAMPKPEAVMVVGLGAEGALTEQGLAGTVRQAVLDWLQRHHERQAHAGHDGGKGGQGGHAAPARIAATLIGSGGIGVSPGAAARVIVAAVVEANRRIRRAGWPPVGELRLIELYLDRAAEAWRELQSQADSTPAADKAFDLAPFIQSGSGAKRRPLDTSYRGANYDLVRIFGRGKDQIEYAMDSRRARSEVRTHSTQRTLVQGLVRQAAHHQQTDRRLGNTLFKLLVPPDIEPYLVGQARLILDMAPSVAGLPWEMLDASVPGVGDQHHRPWAVRTGLLRRMQVAADRGASRRDSQADDLALVVGDPLLPEELAAWQLPHARQEAEAVRQILQQADGAPGDGVVTLLQADALAITNTLFERDWRVIHIAGHGQWDGQKGGVVLSQPDTFLGPKEVRAMRAVPELVFINCCHLADLRDADPAQAARLQRFEPGDLAQGLAAELIKAGVRCVVAAGWAVDDRAARCFATTFYERLRQSEPFGEAVKQAREATYLLERQIHRDQGGQADQPIGNTWAAYQCYGDPDWRLVRDGARTSSGALSLEERYAHLSNAPAVALALESLATDARWGGLQGDQVRAHLSSLVRLYGGPMGQIGAVAEAIGWYERATRAPDGTASFKALEALGNLRSRWAHERARDGGPAVARALLPEAEAGLAILRTHTQVRDTDEAHCLVGSAQKRLALMHEILGSPAAVVDACLDAMREAYEQGLERATATRGNRMYPLANLAALDLRQALGPASTQQQQAQAQLTERLAALDAELHAVTQQDPADEWGRLGLIELALKRAIAAPSPAAWQQALDDLGDLNRRVPGRKMWRTALDQWGFALAAVHDGERQAMKDTLLSRLSVFASRA